jgi:hypothetical protein
MNAVSADSRKGWSVNSEDRPAALENPTKIPLPQPVVNASS